MAAYSANDTGILLESGTNELELLEFNVCGNSYGINIAKVREINDGTGACSDASGTR